MFTALSAGAINVKVGNLQEAIAAAKQGGFEGVDFDAREVADLIDAHGVDHVKGLFADAAIRPGGWGLPVDWRGSDENWRAGLEQLPRLAHAAASIGGPRTSTWVLPGSNDLPFEENRTLLIDRFTPIAAALAAEGCRLGLEFIGPKTLRAGLKYPFIYRMEDMLALGTAIGPNVGLLLDAFHWYTSGGTVADLQALRTEQVVYVHVNDAIAGVSAEEQIDNIRALPGETGVIDINSFLQTLEAIGYDGPVTPEPFKKELKDLPSDAARLERVGASMRAIFAGAGVKTK